MKSTILILYFLAVISGCIALELTDWLCPKPWYGIYEMNLWFVGFIARVLLYFSLSLMGCVALIKVMEDLKIK